MPGVTSDTFFTALVKSNLLSPTQLAAAQAEATAMGANADAKTVARGLIKKGLITRWQAEQLLAGVTNLFLGRYKLLERIGKGGMGTVYRAEHTVMGRTVALKVMSQALLNDAGAVARFQREVQAAASLQHPNVVTAYDADCVGKTHFLVMEYVEGHDLKERLQQQGRLSVGWVCECIRQAALGLQHAHEHGMVHRDIKPANLLVTSERPGGPPLVKILDMGLARFVSDVVVDGGLTKSGQVMGTPDYIAPEQAEDTKHADIRADIFSLGCSLFHLLTGQTPYKGDTLMSKLMARMQDTVPPASSLRSDVPQALDAVIAKMLQKKPADRQQTPAEVATALAPFTATLDAAFEDTMAVTNVAAMTPTIDLHDSHPDVDTGLNKFLGELANTPDHRKQRVGQRTNKQRKAEPEQKAVALDGGEQAAQTDLGPVAKISPRVLIAAACAAVVVLGGIAAFVLSRGTTTVAEVESVTQESSEPVSTLPEFNGEPVETSSTSDVASPAADTPPPQPAAKAIPANAEPIKIDETMPTPPLAEMLEKEVDNTAPTAPPPPAPAVAAKEPHKPQTLVVGVGTGELPDLKAAFEQAGPGDTILIRHRGPLEFNPVDLNGKTPLTVVGDTATGGTDYWPIIRQIPLNPGDNTQPTTAVGLFHGDQLDLTLRKLHLAVGGPQRANLGSVFGFRTGRIELDECTVTVGVAGNPGEPTGQPIRFVRIMPSSTATQQTSSEEKPSLADVLETTTSHSASAEVILNQTFLRGLRLQSCVDADSEHPLHLTATHTIWAGGPSAWLVVNDHGGGLKVALTNCTIYNAPRLLGWKSYDGATTVKPTVDFNVQKSVFVGPYANKEPLMAWNEGQPNAGFDRAAADGTVRWQGEENVFHRYPSYFQLANAREQPGLDEWRLLWKQSGPNMDQEADPMFRVWPDGEEMQETTAYDFQSRFWKAKRATRVDDKQAGAEHGQMPYALVNIFGRPLPKPDVAGTPCGVPRVLGVNQKDGPYKTLEAAFADARDEDIIEITDDGPYTPRRNFDTAPASGVLITPAGNLTLRARDGVDPIVVLRDDVQIGQLPTPPGSAGTALVLLSTSIESSSFAVEGIHFRSAVLRPIRRSVLCCPQGVIVKVSSSTFLDVGRPLEKASGGFLSPDPANSALFLLTDSQRLIWLENCMFYPANRDACWSLWSYNGFPRSGLVRNCGCEGTLAKLNDNGLALDLKLNSCTLIGSISGLNYARVLRANDNFVYSSMTLFPPEVAGALSSIRVDGANNCLWLGERRMTEAERSGGVAGLIRGPLIASVPTTEGTAIPRDPLRRYRLKKGQPAAKMAADGGPVGLRFEYLPDLSALPTAFFEGL
jgi:serine/threonine protein kinase